MQSRLFAPETSWPPTRTEALRRLAAFVPRAGHAYAAQRNFDRGPGDRANVSTLSPYVRHRLVTETELLAAVLARHTAPAAEKFIQEIFWRTYWKGWLEAHPATWSRFRSTLAERLANLETDPVLARSFELAAGGHTGIDAFDAWARELVDTNYLHNHARMWFASIWIFTLQLPWELGADLFMRHLLDGDPASNTLSWRWVAGLQTRAKTYRATRDNIRRYTGQRFALIEPLARVAPPLHDEPVPLIPLPALELSVSGAQPTLLVLHEDDLRGDGSGLPAGLRGVCAIRSAAGRSPQPLSAAVLAFTDTAALDALGRIASAAGALNLGLLPAVESTRLPAAGVSHARPRGAEQLDVVGAAAACGATRIVAPFAPVGSGRDALASVRAAAARHGLAYAEIGRRYDAVSWPFATGGFFNLRASIPAILRELGIGPG